MIEMGIPKGKSYDEFYGQEKSKKIRRRQRLAQLGTSKKEETKKKISLTLKGRHTSPQTEFKKGHPNYNLYQSEQTKKKLSKTMKKLLKKGEVKPFMEGKTHSIKTRKKIGESRRKLKSKRGYLNSSKTRIKISKALKGKKLPDKTKEKMSITSKKHWRDPKYQKRLFKARAIKPTKPEKVLIKLIKENNYPFKYVGDYSFFIGRLNPDFIGTEGNSQKIIELFGDYWHKINTSNKCVFIRTEWGRKLYYKSKGYDCLIIWGSELNNLEKVKQKIESWNN